MDAHHIIQVLTGLVITIMAFFMKNLHTKTEKTSDELARYKEYVALNHPVNDSIDKRFDKIENKIDKILDKMDSK